MGDYDSMSNEELQRAIAERLGYRSETVSHPNITTYRLLDPEGQSMGGLAETEGDEWQFAPNWVGSVDRALSLIPPLARFALEHECTPIDAPMMWHAYIDPSHPAGHEGSADTPARAIVICLLRANDAQG